MDEKFKMFEKWYLKRKKEWYKRGIYVDESGLSEFGHQYWIKVHSKNGIGNIILYESNGYYWIDFEAGNIDYDNIFCKGNIDFDDISFYEKEFIKYMI